MATVVAVLATPSQAGGQELPEFTGDEFNDLFTTARLDNLAPIGPAPSITGNWTTDQRIRQIGEARGYLRRPLPEGPLQSVGGYLMQPSAVDAWIALRDAAKAAGHTLVLRSAYRSHSTQTAILLQRLYSYSDSAIDYRLRSVAVPGYSKHHTGYAIDITQPGYAFTNFQYLPVYRWLAADNYANAKRFGWIPSYPPDAVLQGPQPEAWEFTYVGLDNIRCFGFESSEADTFCDDHGSIFADDIEWLSAAGITAGCNAPLGNRFCPEDPVTRGQFAALLHRALGDSLPSIVEPVSFSDTSDSTFAGDVAWLYSTGITRGCGPDTFCPDDPVTRGQLAAFFVRAFGYADGFGSDLFVDDNHSIFADQIDALATVGVTRGCNPPDNDRFCPDAVVTRAQMAAFLHRALGG
ncbi:MAG: D-alanyl-D-alanine carboxypeptidase family protein [Acidimicrobiia bacterium]|nr:D-alanyl-D-alanine carboxypeptidase family protein [Acidimicrobiia bacterium]